MHKMKSKPIAKKPESKHVTVKSKPVLLQKKNDPPPDLPEQDEPDPESEPIADEQETEEIVDSDPMPQQPIFSGKDEDFPSWRQADMRYKEQLSEWLARHRAS